MRCRRPSLISLIALVASGCGGGGSSGGIDIGNGSGDKLLSLPLVSLPLTNTPKTFETEEYFRSTAHERVRASSAYAVGADGSGVTVGVIDTGIDTDHPELRANLHAKSTDIVVARNGMPLDDVGKHGTAVAGIIAARRDGNGMHGIAPKAKLLAVRADREGTCPDGCRFGQSDLAAATDYARTNGAAVINYSLTASDLGDGFEHALRRAADAGAVLVMAAGNHTLTDPEYPGRFATSGTMKGRAIVVGALSQDDRIASFSNRAGVAKDAFIVAPGTRIHTTYVGGRQGTLSGTSIAAPIVSGAAALILDAAPHLTPEQVVALLLNTAEDLGDPGVDAVYGHGLLDLDAALSPQGSLVVAEGDEVDDGGAAASDSTWRLSPAYGDGDGLRAALADAVAFDALGRAYKAGLDRRVAASSPSPLAAWLAPDRDLAGSGGFGPVRLGFTADVDTGPSTTGTATPWRTTGRTAFTAETALGPKTDLSLALDARPAILDGPDGIAPAAGSLAAFAAAGGGVGIRHALSPVWRFETALIEGRLGDDAGDRRGIVAALGRDLDGGDLRLAVGRLVEADGALGATAQGAFAAPAAGTTVVGVDGAWQLAPKLRLTAGLGLGVTDAAGGKGLVRGTTPLVSSSGGVALSLDGFAAEDDRLSFGIAQPLRVEDGRIVLDVPTGRDLDGRVERERRKAGLAPDGRELRLEAGYDRPLGLGRVSLKGIVRLEPGHEQEAAPEAAVGVRWSTRF